MKRVVVICPGRGTYNKPELGSLARLHPDKGALFEGFDKIRLAEGQESLAALDGAARYSIAKHTRGDNAAALIYAASYADFRSLVDVEVVAVTGNSMGWYSTLACAGALDADQGFRLVNTMGQLMQDSLVGGQLVYPICGDDWRIDAARRTEVMELLHQINAMPEHQLALSIDLGGMLVLAGNDTGLDAFAAKAKPLDRFPMRLANHAAFHTVLQEPVSRIAKRRFDPSMFAQPDVAMIDGRGGILWPHATDPDALFDYTLGRQVVESYDFTRAIRVAAQEFAPDMFVVLGPGTTLGGAVAQSLIAANWGGMDSKDSFQRLQADAPLLISMGRDDQRDWVTTDPS
ncbi:ACP S-malonyltransferase [Sulfitobacter sp. F26204]|uniref:ACP S-malonyltransferase n=1 Tax=Sulfitobacter sp. F26204 TaxID=2996014 RepID=UPI00225DD038|nr:ACP S-malonyltransferase [Sulfitobacter sp. F26204]MCX7561281.1 ACP S-malonyltransferase [Sulfitobacter sp. F26204]